MAKTTAPLMSFEAAGQLGNALVFSKWKGRPYARRYTIPANPDTAAQQTVRNSFQWLQRTWPFLPSATRASWTLYADNSRFTERNGWTKINQPLLRSETDLTNILLSTAAGGGIASGGATFTAASQAITIAITAPTLPSGWSIVAAHSCAIEDGNPQTGFTPDIAAGTDTTDPYEPNISGLLATTQYVVNAWFEYLKPDGSSAYGAVETDVVTTLA